MNRSAYGLDADQAPDWRTQAACRDHDPELWHSLLQPDIDAATSICRSCPVRDECLAYAEQIGDKWAVLGGLTAEERAAARRREIRPMYRRECRRCRHPYATFHAGQKYCGTSCAALAGHEQRRAKKEVSA